MNLIFQAIFGVGLPVTLKDQSVTVGSVMKANYKLRYLTDTPVGNLSYTQLFADDDSRSADGISKRDVNHDDMSLTRWHVYKSIETLVNRYFIYVRLLKFNNYFLKYLGMFYKIVIVIK